MQDSAGTLLAFRILTKTSFAHLKKWVPILREEMWNKKPETKGFNEQGMYISSDYRTVFHLVTNREYMKDDVLLYLFVEAFILTKLLQRTEHFFTDTDGVPFTPKEEDLILTGSLLVHHLMSVICNCQGLGPFKVSVI